MTDTLTRLRQLLAAASPLPWELRGICDKNPVFIAANWNRDGVPHSAGHCPEDHALIAAAVNALPLLLAVCEAAKKHIYSGESLGTYGDLNAALAALDKAGETT